MNKLKRIAGINLIILLFYTIATRIAADSDGLIMALCIAFQVGVNLIIAVVSFIKALGFSIKKDFTIALSYLLSAGIVLLIGFSICVGFM
jgi:hypothetical protein